MQCFCLLEVQIDAVFKQAAPSSLSPEHLNLFPCFLGERFASKQERPPNFPLKVDRHFSKGFKGAGKEIEFPMICTHISFSPTVPSAQTDFFKEYKNLLNLFPRGRSGISVQTTNSGPFFSSVPKIPCVFNLRM